MSLLAEVQAASGNIEQALITIVQAIDKADTINEHWWYSALHCLKGDFLLLLSPHNTADAEVNYYNALRISEQQGARSLGLRAATQLSLMLKTNNDIDRVTSILAPVIESFGDDQQSDDLTLAKSILSSCSGKF